MTIIDVLDKYLAKTEKSLESLPSEDLSKSTNTIREFRRLAELSTPKQKILENNEFYIALNFNPQLFRYSTDELGFGHESLTGQLSYLVRRKSDDQVISGNLKIANRPVLLSSGRRYSSVDPDIQCSLEEYEQADIKSILELLSENKLIKKYINEGVSIDDYSDFNKYKNINVVRTLEPFLELNKYSQGHHEVISANQFEHVFGFQHYSNNKGPTTTGSSYYLEIGSVIFSAPWLEKNGLLLSDDVIDFKLDMIDAIEETTRSMFLDTYYDVMKHGLPETINADSIGKYLQTELNFIRAKPNDPDPRSAKFRHQYVDKMRNSFGVVETNQFNMIRHKLQRAGLKVPESVFSPDYALYLFVAINQKKPMPDGVEIDIDRLSSISKGVIDIKSFLDDSSVKNVNKNTFNKLLDLVDIGALDTLGFDDLIALTTLPNEILNPSLNATFESEREQTEYVKMVSALYPYLTKYAHEVNQASEIHKKSPTNESKIRLKHLSEQYKWLSREGKTLENYQSLSAKLKAETLSDYWRIVDSYLSAIKYRVILDLSSEADDVFSITLEEGNTEIVDIDLSEFHNQFLESIEDEEKDFHVENSLFELVKEFASSNDLPLEKLFEGVAEDAIKQARINHGFRGSDFSKIHRNLQEIDDDLTDEFDDLIDSLEEIEADFDLSMRYEQPSDTNGMKLFHDLKKSSSDYRNILELNELAHKVQGENQRALAAFSRKDNFSWTPLFNGSYDIAEDLKIEVICDKERLLDEGITQQHCVFSYLKRAMCGESIILSVTNNNGERVATVELQNEGDLEEPEFVVEQCLGKNNERVHRNINHAVDDFIERINQEPEEFDLPEEITAEIDLDDAEDNPSHYANLLSDIPFATEAAHKSYFILKNIIPSNYVIEEFLSKEGWGEYFNHSKLKKDLDIIERIVSEFSVTELDAHAIIDINAEHNFKFDYEKLKSHIELTHGFKANFWNSVEHIVETENNNKSESTATLSYSYEEPKVSTIRPRL